MNSDIMLKPIDSITYQIVFNNNKVKNVTILCKKGILITKGKILGKYHTSANIEKFLKAKDAGTVLEVNNEENIITIEKCKHSMSYGNLCSYCGEHLSNKNK